MNGRVIVIEGLDGSGKHTQAVKLYESMKVEGKSVRLVSFPNYESPSSALVKMYLSGEMGSTAGAVNPFAASSFYAVDRYASFRSGLLDFYRDGGTIIADRYTTSNAIHQCSKLPEEDWDEYLHWLFDFEYRLLDIPAPDAVIYLRVDPEMSQALMTARYNSDESKKDIHEADLDYMKRSRSSADYCARTLGWHTVECVSEGSMRSIEDIASEIGQIVNGI